MKKLVVVMLALAALLLVGCTTVTPLTATSNSLGGLVGEATGTYLFGVIPLGAKLDMGIQKAAQNGGITQISTVDVKVRVGLFTTKVSTVVTGQ